jgi:hypothetical protein
MRSTFFALLVGFAAACHGQQQPNVEAQRNAMKKPGFLAGRWSGEASVIRGPGEAMKLLQTEEVQFKMDGLVIRNDLSRAPDGFSRIVLSRGWRSAFRGRIL